MLVSYIVWGVCFTIVAALELLAAFGLVPWKTLSATAWALEGYAAIFKIAFLAGLVVLTVHIVARWP